MILFPFRVSNSDRIIFYRQLATMLSAGLTMFQALSTLKRASPAGRMRRAAAGIGECLAGGESFSGALAAHPEVFPEHQIELIRVGEKSGRLAENLNLIAGYLERVVRSRRKLLGGLLYPAVLFHLAVFLAPFPSLIFAGDFTGYLKQTLGFLLLVYLVLFGLLYLLPSLFGVSRFIKKPVDTLILFLPVLGGVVRRRNIANFAYSYLILHEAGVGVVEGLRRAATVCTNEFIRDRILLAAELVKDGNPVSESIEKVSIFPRMVLNMWATGEESGSLSVVLKKISEYLWEESERTTEEAVRWIPKIVYLGICAYVAWVVIHAWLFYYQEFGRVIGK